jgi:hypothetical protein
VVVSDDERGGIRQNRAFENLAGVSEAGSRRSQSHQMTTNRVILAVKIDRVKSLLGRVLIERRPEVVGNLLSRIKDHLFTEANEVIDNLSFINAHW